MKYRYPNSRILIFAREPVLGKVKTRLQTELGASRTFDLHCALITYQVEQVTGKNLAPTELWVTSNPSHPLFLDLGSRISTFEQNGDDLGQRMFNATDTVLQRAQSVIIIGADCPSVDSDYLEQALNLLSQDVDVVLGPAEDGGYVLLGLTQVRPELFNGIPWGSGQVLECTLERLNESGLSYTLLDSRWDVDRPEDLVRLAELQPSLRY